MAITPQTTIGVEAEFHSLGANATKGMEQWLRFRIGDDGSVRGTTYTAGDLAVCPQLDATGKAVLSVGMKPQSRFGLEIITEPYTYQEFLPIAQKFAWYTSSIPQNSRTSIHIHVDAGGETWHEIKSLLLWVRALEAPIYRMACGGRTHRGALSYGGEPNDHKFARPLSNPIGIEYSSGKVGPLVNWDMVKAAKSASELMAAWGRLDLYWGGMDHYMPHRLHMINLASIIRQGTIEWRVFDGMYQYLDKFVELVYNIHALSSKGTPDVEFLLGSMPKIDADWMSNLLDMDVSVLWGENWQVGCVRNHPLSHYSARPTFHSLSSTSLARIYNKYDKDDFSTTFVPYIRRK